MKTNQIACARIIGYSLILMAVAAGFSLGYAYPLFYDTHPEKWSQNIIANPILYQAMLCGLIFILILDVLVSGCVYKFFKATHPKLSLYSSSFRMIYSLIFALAIWFLAQNEGIRNHQIIIENQASFQKTWSIGLIFFGVHLYLLGLLIIRNFHIPTLLGKLAQVAGILYIVIHLIKVIFPTALHLVETLNAIFALPMALGELCLAVWLIWNAKKFHINR